MNFISKFNNNVEKLTITILVRTIFGPFLHINLAAKRTILF